MTGLAIACPVCDSLWQDVTGDAPPGTELISPNLVSDAIVVAGNAVAYLEAYADYFAFLRAPSNQFRTITLPFDGGRELTVRCA